MTLGEKIKKLRKERNMSQGDLADCLETHQTAVSQFELNKKKPSRDTLVKLSKVFEVSVDYFIDEENPHYSESEKSFVNEYTKLFPSELNLKVSELAEEYKTGDDNESILTKEEAEDAVKYIKYLLSQRKDR
ncbi:helix-turn-helix transcriptional regulator [Bacillus velezensis]|uniref:helix-turn-helix domain-containing protein n=1 Tax=Bacillus TaxID=1386 RepID=UPI001C52FC8E|nr:MULTISPECIES: helix-turn-helix transcriptional regulator [Bacillus amyloliquefaciens group]QXP95497.1 helix-turn-helix transcriptional regulator [Bacillus velezensis]QXP99283.1 helix-turn-helix transcriptional regulator [Bacillus velezensis]UHH01376.1 helix-turn-helix transcriptional regulator [Bacillus amyloliquefaciens]ULR21123.1 helix-turn-helix transcriptional regulator [Bacillus velezensis]UVW07866.1 helix-turn-helix transcriptional regulator [Bacillus velezensis]